ncbi:MAG: hypothetical protein K2K53_14000 [Oscillospiraceae bacterium]|nr:hypothetical protein [Oscillospiraceae bacterium]
MPGGDAYKTKVIKQLKKGGLLRTYYADGLRGFRLTAAAKKLLLEGWPDQFSSYLTGCTETNTLKSEPLRRLRLHRMAEVLVTMYNADVDVFPWQKPAVFSPMLLPDDTWIECPAYYSSREVKEIGPQRDKIRGSRATGVLLTERDTFSVYNTGSSEMKWEHNAEMRLKVLLKIDLCQHRLSHQYMDAEQSAIVFGTDMKQMPILMGVGGDQRHRYFVIEEHYRHFYYMTSDHCGEVVLRLLCEPDKRAMLDDILMQDLVGSRPHWLVENDAMDGEDPVLFGYACDMPRIKRFTDGLDTHGFKGTIYCFDFQEDAMRQICGPNVDIQCINFEKFEELL